MKMWSGVCVVLIVACCASAASTTQPAWSSEEAQLAREVGRLGWLMFTGKSGNGDFDLFVCRPDGSSLRNITNTPQFNEFNARFSNDGRKILYRRIPASEHINHTLHGQFGEFITANTDGSAVAVHGKPGEYPWASWSPDDRQIACLYKKEGKIRIFDLETKKLLKEMPRYGVFQQLYWSPDGKRLCGCANVNGMDWNIVDIELATGNVTLLSRDLNCTPDYFHDSLRVLHSHRQPGLADGYGFTMIMRASVDGKQRTLVYGERNRHVYWSCASPDDRYVIFCVFPEDNGIDGEMTIVRLSDTPMVAPSSIRYKELENLYPGCKSGPILRLRHIPNGFEPHWTGKEIGI